MLFHDMQYDHIQSYTVPYPGGGPWGAWPPPIEKFASRERKREKREGEKEKRNLKRDWEMYYFLHIVWPVYLVVHSTFLKNSKVFYW